MAATRAIAAVAGQTASCLLSKRPFALKQKPNSICFNRKTFVVSKRLFSCNAIYNPEVQIKEEGQPETLDYRVFFVTNSGKKVLFSSLFLKMLCECCMYLCVSKCKCIFIYVYRLGSFFACLENARMREDMEKLVSSMCAIRV